jgi:tetratricopeptide (TPR) repeat protein
MEPPINQAQYLFHRGMCWTAKSEFERAVADYGASIAIYPNHPGPYHLRAKVLVNELGRYADALPDLDRLLAMREVPQGLQLRGFALVNLGRHRDAVADLERANRLAPDAYNDYLLAACFAATADEARLRQHMHAALEGWDGYREYFATLAEEFAPYRERPWFRELIA